MSDEDLVECEGCQEEFTEEEFMTEVSRDAWYCTECYVQGEHR